MRDTASLFCSPIVSIPLRGKDAVRLVKNMDHEQELG
jgi:hypothetical protein